MKSLSEFDPKRLKAWEGSNFEQIDTVINLLEACLNEAEIIKRNMILNNKFTFFMEDYGLEYNPNTTAK